ncbi:MAG: TIGR02281 family clan AA aspartic protease [Leptolyngbyaceae cyanobacterium]
MACQTDPIQTERLETIQTAPVEEAATANTPESPQHDLNASAYQDAINLASSAFTLGQQAQSPDDWDLIVGRWEQAIEKLKAIPAGDQNYAVAQTKLQDYQRNLSQAKQRLTQASQPVAELALPRSTAPIASGSPVAAAPATSLTVPIIERRGGTPVIEVSFNGKRYPMILDTGASHTHITRAMANELDIEIVGQTSVATASSRQAVVDVGYVKSVQVGNVSQTNLPVSIGDAVPIGLLGNDVYKDFDVTLQVNSVEFRPR